MQERLNEKKKDPHTLSPHRPALNYQCDSATVAAAAAANACGALRPGSVQCRDNAGHGTCVCGNAAVLGDGRVHGRAYRLAAHLVVAQAADGLRPHVLPDRPKSVHVLRHEDHLRCGGRQRLADSARWVYYIPHGLIIR